MKKQTYSFLRLSVRPWGLLTVAGVVASLATVIGFIGRFYWFFDLFSHFRIHYLLAEEIIPSGEMSN